MISGWCTWIVQSQSSERRTHGEFYRAARRAVQDHGAARNGLHGNEPTALTLGCAVVDATMALSGKSTPTATSFPTVGANTDWTPQVKTFDGVEMALVPPGCFMMGASDADIAKQQGNSDEAPQTTICFDAPFWLDKNDVTNGQFKQFNGKAANPSRWTGDNRPREHITWFEARDYCALRGGRLPTEAEWEYATRGPDGLVYPWGNSFEASNVVYSENSGDQTADVGSKPGGASWVGALDMAGNVWQWTNSLNRPYPYNNGDGRENNSDTSRDRVLRGGSYNNNEYDLRSAGRVDGAPDYYYVIGFRCARAFEATPTVAATATPISGAAVSAVAANNDWTP
jgi:formylglycine-generating enzyme required for sulfatase activity